MFSTAVMWGASLGKRWFRVFRPCAVKTGTGRVLSGEGQCLGEILGTFAKARGSETERWKQLAHPVSHVIVVRGKLPFPLQVGDVLRCEGREFLLNVVPYDVGELGHWTEIYCEERYDLL